jgi:hypothetical protein
VNIRVMRFTSRIVIAAMLSMTVPFSSVQAGLVSTDKVSITASQEANRDRIRAFLDREDVRAQLQRQGVSPEQAKARVNALTDDEVQRVAGRLDQLPAGGDILGVLLTVFVILLITDILGFTKVFSFTRPIK